MSELKAVRPPTRKKALTAWCTRFLVVLVLMLWLPWSAATIQAAPPTGGTGPGGFELNSGGGSLVLWFQADAITGAADGSPITTWANSAATTGAGSNATAGTAPSFQSGGADLINGNPVVRFSGATGANTGSHLNGSVSVGGPKTFFSAIKDTGTTGNCCSGGIGTRTSGSGNWNGLMSFATGGDVKFFADRSGAGVSGTGSLLNVTTVGTLTYETTATTIYRNGVVDGSNASNFQSTGTSYQLGTRNNQLSRFFKGDMGESGAFNRLLNGAERVILENYLGAKWDVTLGTNDLYAGDTAANGDYDLGVFGVATLPDQQLSSVTSAGSAGFGIETNAALVPGASLLAGHAVANNSELADRWERLWYVDVRNLNGTESLNLAFDWTDAGLGAPDPEFIDLLFSSTEDGPFSSIATGTLTGTTVNFDALSGSLFDSGFFTLGAPQSTGNGGGGAVPEPASIVIWLLIGLVLAGYGCRRLADRIPSRGR